MNYEQMFADINHWIQQNNEVAKRYGFDTDEYWHWVVKSSGELCDYYQNTPLVINLMLGLWNYLQDIIVEKR